MMVIVIPVEVVVEVAEEVVVVPALSLSYMSYL